MEQRKKYIIKKADGGQISPEEMAMMEQQAAAQAQQGAPQQGGGQDEAMQQIMQMVEQMIQQGAQPADVAAELLGQQVPPEAIMQVFVEMGLPQQEAQAAIEQAMQAGPPQEGAPQGPPQGQPSPEEMAAMQQQEGQPPMMWHGGDHGEKVKDAGYTMGTLAGQLLNENNEVESANHLKSLKLRRSEVSESEDRGMEGITKTLKRVVPPPVPSSPVTPPVPAFNPAYTMSALFGQKDARIERDPTEQSARNHQTRIGATAKEGMTPAEWAEYKKDLEITKGYTDMNVQGQPTYMVPMDKMKAGGDMFRKLMKKAWGGNLTAPAASSEDYVSDRAAMFVNAVKQNTAMATLNESMKGDPFAKAGLPTASLGGLPKFEGTAGSSDVNSETAADDDLAFNEKQQAYIDNLKSGFKKIQAQGNSSQNPNWQQTPGIVPNQQGVNYQGFSGYNPYMNNMTVGYRDPRQFTMMDELQRGTNPWARFLGNTGRTFSNPTIRGNNLPGGMSGADFLSQMKGMSGVGPDGTPYRVSSGERYVEKDGTFLKNLNPFVRRQPTRRGVRYNIDYGTGLTDGTQEGGASEEGTAPGTSGAMSREDMLNSMTRNEKRQFRKMQRGRDQVSANEAYDVLKGDRGGTEAPSSLEQMRANAAAAGDPLNQTQLEQMRANAAAAGDPGSQGFQPMTEENLSKKQLRDIKKGKTSLEDINLEAERQYGIDQDIAAGKLAEETGVDADGNVVPVEGSPYFEQPPLATTDSASASPANSFVYGQDGSPFPERTTPDFSAAEDYTGPVQMTEQLQEKMMLDNYGKGMTTGAPADPGITRMPLKPAFGTPGEPTIVGNVPGTKAELENKMMLDNYGKGMKSPGYFSKSNNQNSNASMPIGENPNYAAEIEGINKEPIELLNEPAPVVNPQNEPPAESFTEPWIKNGQSTTSTTPVSVPAPLPELSREEMLQRDIEAAGGMTYGGGVSPQALANAVNLINRAFGGSIPQAVNGMDLQGRLSMEEALAKQGLNGFGTVDVETEQGMQWGNKRDLGQALKNTAQAVTFFDQAGENAEAQRINDRRAQSSLIGADSFNQLQVGLDNQQGARNNTDFNNQNLNVNSNVGTTFSAFGGQPQMMMYGGQYYQIGGDVDLSPEKLAEFEKAGFVLTRK